MALPDLTGQNIENTYQRVLQTDGTVIYDGTGSVFLPVSASYSVTASYAEYAVSASHEIIKEVSSSYADYAKESGLSTSSISASYAITASYALNSPDIFPYTGSAIISGSLEVTGSTSLQSLTASGLYYPDTDGTEFMVLRTDGSGNLSFDYSDRTNLEVRTVEAVTKGDPLRVVGFNNGQNRAEVRRADALNSSLMPSYGLAYETVGANVNTQMVALGALDNVNTQIAPNDFQEGDILYVQIGGGLTNVKPTGSALIQNVGKVARRQQNSGEILVSAIGRSNDVPNIQPGYAWVGNEDWVATAVSTSSFNEDPFPYTGSAVISGSLEVTGSISSTDTVTAVTGSFSHLKGNSPITVQDPVTFQHTQGLDVLGNATIHSINEVELQTISKDFNYTSSLNITEITSSVNGMVIDYRLTNLNSGSRVGTFMYAHDGTELSYNDLTIPGGGIGGQPILSASLVNDLVKIDIENAAGFNFTGYAKKFNKLANAIPVADPNINYVLNEYPSENVVGAYSIRQLDQFYTGSAMRIRRASDNSELDIEYDVNGYLDTLAIEAHCGGSVGHVTIWYDQSSNNRHLTQSTAANQPKIYDGTSIYEVNGQPCIRTRDESTNPVLIGPSGVDYTNGASIYLLINGAGYNTISPNQGWYFRYGTVQSTFYVGSNAVNLTSLGRTDSYQELFAGFYDSTTTTAYAFRRSGQFVPSFISGSTNATMPSTIGNQLSINRRGDYQELIIMNDYEISNREGIFTNINDYYTIYDTGLLAEYPGAAAAYSVRLLHSVYTGPSLRVREDGTNTETDIGFDSNGDLDTASIASHCGANNGLVVTWYDQSGNGNDATQSTVGNQPKIYDGTTGIVLENGKPAIDNQGGTNELLFTSISSVTNIAGVAKANVGGFQYIVGQGTDGALRTLNGNWSSSANSQDFPFNGALFINSSQMGTISAQSQRLIFANAESGGTSLNLSVIGGTYPARHWDGPIQEVILWTTNQSSNRTGIESNINTYFNIYP